jgi:hypothetical protein
MISDQITLGSSSAYLRNDSGSANLGGTSPSTARTKKLEPNQIWDISGLELLIEGDDLTPLLHLPDTLDNPLMEIKIQKEVFPSLFANPFETRVHNVAGFDDFERGKSSNCFVTEVNNIPTLVSKGTDLCNWESVVYKLPYAIDIYAASWELATSRLVNEEQFEYTIELYIWPDHDTDVEVKPIELSPIKSPDDDALHYLSDADDARKYHLQENERKTCQAFKLRFYAKVKVDSAFYESHRMEFNSSHQVSTMAGDTIGIPLLRSIRLLERVESNYRFYSLNELIQAASFYQMFDQQGSNFNRLLLNLDVSAVLVGREKSQDSETNDFEFLEFDVSSLKFQRVQAKLLIDERLRIPRQ